MNKCLVLDRDGVLNKLLIRPDGSTDSPMNLSEIEVFYWIPRILKTINSLGYNLVIATNQPAAAKGKISKNEIINIHNNIVMIAESNGAKILSSHICFHRAEDLCNCRKPKTGLLEEIFSQYHFDKAKSWMVGDRATDIIAGSSFGLKTILLGPSVLSDLDILQQHGIKAHYQMSNLNAYTSIIGALSWG